MLVQRTSTIFRKLCSVEIFDPGLLCHGAATQRKAQPKPDNQHQEEGLARIFLLWLQLQAGLRNMADEDKAEQYNGPHKEQECVVAKLASQAGDLLLVGLMDTGECGLRFSRTRAE